MSGRQRERLLAPETRLLHPERPPERPRERDQNVRRAGR